MARLALVLKQRRQLREFLESKRAGTKSRFSTRVYRRCNLCGRRHGYMRAFGMCRICFRELATRGDIPGIKKSSW